MADEYVPLASSDDVKAVLGRDLTSGESAKVGAVMAKASELFRLRSGQMFTPGESVVRLKVDGGEVRLPQRPVVAVESVTRDDGTPVQWSLFGSVLTVPLRSSDFVRVTYSHGGVVPEVVKQCIAEVAARVLTVDPVAATGVTQHGKTDGPFSEQFTFAAWAVGGQTLLSPADEALAASFRVKLGHTVVLRP